MGTLKGTLVDPFKGTLSYPNFRKLPNARTPETPNPQQGKKCTN